jgi:hypothetical protein
MPETGGGTIFDGTAACHDASMSECPIQRNPERVKEREVPAVGEEMDPSKVLPVPNREPVTLVFSAHRASFVNRQAEEPPPKQWGLNE